MTWKIFFFKQYKVRFQWIEIGDNLIYLHLYRCSSYYISMQHPAPRHGHTPWGGLLFFGEKKILIFCLIQIFLRIPCRNILNSTQDWKLNRKYGKTGQKWQKLIKGQNWTERTQLHKKTKYLKTELKNGQNWTKVEIDVKLTKLDKNKKTEE